MTSRRPVVPALLLAVLVAVAAVAAAVGSGSAQAGAEQRAKGAAAVPADALAYASVSLDRGGAPFRALEALAAKVDGGEAAVARLNDELDGSSDGARMLRALGGDVSVGLVGIDPTPVAAGGQPAAQAVVVATAADGAALTRLLEQRGFAAGPAVAGRPVWEKDAMAVSIDGSTAIAATSRATLARAIAAQAGDAPSLADDPAFTATIAKLPSDPVAVAYLAPARLAGVVRAVAPLLPDLLDGMRTSKGAKAPKGASPADMAAALTRLSRDLEDVRGLGIAVTAEAGGLRIVAAGDADQAALERLGARFPTAYAPSITGRIPAGALGFAAFRDLGPTLAAAVAAAERQDPQIAALVAWVAKTTGVGFDELTGALGGEHAVYAVGGQTPGVALITLPQDPARAEAVLGRAVAAARTLAAAQGEAAGATDASRIAVTRDGGTVAVGTIAGAAAAPSAAVADDPAFRAIADRAGLPAEVTGLAYADAARLRAQAADRGMRTSPALAAVRGVIAWGTAAGGEAFVAIG